MDLAMQELKQSTFLREKDKLLGFIRNRVSNVEEAEDILQDVFYQFVVGFEAIESLDRVTSWLYSVARNKIIDRYRRDAVRPKRTDFELLAGKEARVRGPAADRLAPRPHRWFPQDHEEERMG